ncbi:MAG: hypothetical protein KY453_04580 [Gemmatimonadetes bacterium]|nr:hypothetical protein [Gemmatimonadota bacterium]
MTRTLSILLGLALAASPAPAGAQAQECARGVVSHVFVDNKSIYDPDELDEDTSFRWAFELANALHVRTKARFIGQELLFRAGDCYDPFLLEESERLLRDYGFISRADVFGIQQPDGSWHVVVDTKDEWTTKVDLGVDFDGGLGFRKVEIAEENLLGRGILLGAFFRESDEERDLGGQVALPRIFGTRLDTRVSGGRTRIGSFFEEELFYPFVGEVGRFAGRQGYIRRESLFPYATGDRGDITHVLLPMEEERVEITAAARIGEPGNLTIFGMGFNNETLEFPRYPSELEAAPNEDFGATVPADTGAAEAIRPQVAHSAATRVNLLVGQRNIRFRRFEGLDALRGVHDVPLGVDFGLTLGRSLAFLSSGEGQPDDIYTRGRLFFAAASDIVLATLAGGVEGRQVFSGGQSGDGWKDVLGELDLYLYWQPPAMDRHTFFVRASGAGGWQTTMPFQLTLGGREGVRGFHDRELPGGRRMVVTVEDRVYLGWPFPDLFDMGITLFGDVGAVKAGDVPFGVDSGLRGTLGAGLRVGFPAGTRGVVRLDAAVPVGGGRGFSDTIFRMSVSDLVGLLSGFEDSQLARSRRVTVGPDHFTRDGGTR